MPRRADSLRERGDGGGLFWKSLSGLPVGGRMVFGVGAGWNVREHEMFGYDLGDLRMRTDRFAEVVEVITHLKWSDRPVFYSGRYYTLKDVTLLPRSRRAMRTSGMSRWSRPMPCRRS